LKKSELPAHDSHLLKNIFLGLERAWTKMWSAKLKDDTFYALIWVEREGQMMTIGLTPQRCAGLALRMDCPIFCR